VPFALRTAVDADADALLRLWLALGVEGRAADPRYRMRPGAADTARTFIATRWLSDPDHRVVVAGRDTRVVGFMTAQVGVAHPVLEAPTSVVITDAYVVPGERRAGIGRDLYEAVIDWARGRGAGQIEVGTLAFDRRAVAFWRALGFHDWRVTLTQPLVH
jgi:GNAT superfamily N-acetyltransferase